jgi:tetratricopeptide (TPR) repeat protein
VERHCRELSRAQALLERAPEQALARSTALLVEAPDLLQARILHGRASLRLGQTRTALADLAPLLETEAGALADPATLQDGGRAALREGNLATAARFYRKLGSSAALLPERRQQVVAYVEIAAVLLASESPPGDEALAYLREARRRSAGSGFTSLVVALTGYAWIAQGRQAEGHGALAEISRPSELELIQKRGDIWLPQGLLSAVVARIGAVRARPTSKR